MHHIYVMTNNITSRKYVGQTFGRAIQWRFKDHMKMCRTHKTKNTMMQSDYDRFGEDSFTVEEIVACPEESAHLLEYALMDALGTRNPSVGYNYMDILKGKDALKKVNLADFEVSIEKLL